MFWKVGFLSMTVVLHKIFYKYFSIKYFTYNMFFNDYDGEENCSDKKKDGGSEMVVTMVKEEGMIIK